MSPFSHGGNFWKQACFRPFRPYLSTSLYLAKSGVLIDARASAEAAEALNRTAVRLKRLTEQMC